MACRRISTVHEIAGNCAVAICQSWSGTTSNCSFETSGGSISFPPRFDAKIEMQRRNTDGSTWATIGTVNGYATPTSAMHRSFTNISNTVRPLRYKVTYTDGYVSRLMYSDYFYTYK